MKRLVRSSDSAEGYIRQKWLGTTALKHTCSVKLSQGNKCENHTTASYLAPKVGKLRCCGTGASLRKMDGCGERGALTAAKMFAHSLRFADCVCVQMGEHQTHIVTYYFLLNTWPRLKTTGSLVRR